MKRLLILTTLPVTLNAFLVPFARHFRAKGWHVGAGASGLSSSAASLQSEFDATYDIPWKRSLASAGNIAAVKAVRAAVDAGDYDIVHVHTPIASFLTRFALRNHRRKVKVVYTAHGFHFGFDASSPYFTPYFYAEKLAGQWTDTLVVINQRDYDTCLRYGIVGPEHLRHTRGIGIDLAAYSRPADFDGIRAGRRNEMGIGPDDFLFLMIAEFNPGKRHRDVLEALRQIRDESVHVAFAGEGALLEEMRQLAREYGVGGRAHFLGYRKDVKELLAACDATVLPSAREGLPRSILEAMAMRRLVLGTKIRGIEELLGDSCGLLFAVGAIPELAEAMKLARTNHEVRASYEENAFGKVREYSVDKVLRAHEELYENLLGAKGKQRAIYSEATT